MDGKQEDKRTRLRAELALRHNRLVDAALAFLDTARSPLRHAGTLIAARLELGAAIRQRRTLISEILAYTAHAQDHGEAFDANERLQEAALPFLGQWPATRMLAEPNELAAALATYVPHILALAAEETAIVANHLDSTSRLTLPSRNTLR